MEEIINMPTSECEEYGPDTDIALQIENDIRFYDQGSRSNNAIRKTVIDKLSGTVAAMHIDPNNDKASAIEAKMGIINTLLKTIDDTESSTLRTIKLKQSHKRDKTEEANTNKVNSMVVEFMRNINNNIEKLGAVKCTAPISEGLEHLEETIKNESFVINDEELQLIPDKTAKDIEL